MGGQIALALVLLVASGLMVRSFQKLRDVDPGFDASSVLTFGLGCRIVSMEIARAAVALHHAMLDRLSALPGSRRFLPPLPAPGGAAVLATRCSWKVGPTPGRITPRRREPPRRCRRLLRGDGHAPPARPQPRPERRRTKRAHCRRQQGARECVLPEPGSDWPTRGLVADPPARDLLAWLTIVGVVGNTPTTALGRGHSHAAALHADVHCRRP